MALLSRLMAHEGSGYFVVWKIKRTSKKGTSQSSSVLGASIIEWSCRRMRLAFDIYPSTPRQSVALEAASTRTMRGGCAGAPVGSSRPSQQNAIDFGLGPFLLVMGIAGPAHADAVRGRMLGRETRMCEYSCARRCCV